ncbi:MAG: acyl-CoA dehydrogenase family protein [Chloroflexi bacterium]|nr:acyl-CoA dehydrogenase family protein [Chloroflexota bacterium]
MTYEGYVLPEALRLLKQTVQDYVQKEIIALERELDPEAIELPPEHFQQLSKKVQQMGLWCWEVPERYGGQGFNCFWDAVLSEDAVQHRAGLYLPGYGTFGSPPQPVAYEYGTPEQIETYVVPTIQGSRASFFAITEPSGGSDPARAIRTTAVRDGDDWVINGSKIFISGALQADWGIVFTRTDPQSRRGITCFIVEKGTPGFTVQPVPVIRPWYPTQLFFQDVRVPDRNRLGEVNGGWNILANRLLGRGRIPYSAANLGVSVAAHRMAVEYAQTRETFGALLSSRQAIQWMLVDNEVEIAACRWLVWQAAWRFDAGEEFRKEAAMAKLFSSEMLGRVVDRAVQVHGGYGVSKWLPLERWYREARVRRIGEGPSEVMRMLIARYLFSGSQPGGPS